MHHLLENALLVLFLKVTSLGQGEQLSVGAILHHVVPATVSRAQTERLDDVWVVQAVGDGELRLDLHVVLGRVLMLAHLAELLHGVQHGLAALLEHDTHGRSGAFTDGFAPSAGKGPGARVFLAQLARADEEIVRKAGTQAAGFCTSTGFRMS